MKPVELRQKTKEELENLLVEKQKRTDELGFLLHQKKVKNVKEMTLIKKDIARIITILKEIKK